MLSLEDKTKAIVDALEDIKANDISVINTSKQSQLFDRMIIASGTSNRQTRALADNVIKKMQELGVQVYSSEGEKSGEWVLIDLGEILVHVMQPGVRAYYNLEELWGMHPPRPGK
ncbi:MAG TPA: ribosome silencing factor [Gallionellaceae bacterium]|nr:ribosome silencing factor [Gallionellaceae bacterium]